MRTPKPGALERLLDCAVRGEQGDYLLRELRLFGLLRRFGLLRLIRVGRLAGLFGLFGLADHVWSQRFGPAAALALLFFGMLWNAKARLAPRPIRDLGELDQWLPPGIASP